MKKNSLHLIVKGLPLKSTDKKFLNKPELRLVKSIIVLGRKSIELFEFLFLFHLLVNNN